MAGAYPGFPSGRAHKESFLNDNGNFVLVMNYQEKWKNDQFDASDAFKSMKVTSWVGKVSNVQEVLILLLENEIKMQFLESKIEIQSVYQHKPLRVEFNWKINDTSIILP